MKERDSVEKFSKVENESFFTSPPFSYRPSIAEYLTTFKITRKGFIADILHLDKKKKIKIESFNRDHLVIRLLDLENLTTSEVLLWNYLQSLGTNSKKIIFYPDKVPKKVLGRFYALVRVEEGARFGNISYDPLDSIPIRNLDDYFNKYVRLIRFKALLFGFMGYLFSTLTFLASFIASIVKISKTKGEGSFFIRKFLIKYFAIYFSGLMLSILFLITLGINSVFDLPGYLILLLPLLILIYVVLFWTYCKLALDFTTWIFENKTATENRREWLKFKAFIYNQSRIEEKPLAHYKLWGPFYYYALAVGVVKNENIV